MSSWDYYASWFYSNPKNKGLKIDGQQVIIGQNILEDAIKNLKIVDKGRSRPKD